MKFKDELIGERITLKRLIPSQELAEIMFETIDANREHLRSWLPWEKPTLKVEDSFNYLTEHEKDYREGKKVGYGVYLDDKYMGNIGFFDIDEKNKSGEIGYWLSSEFGKSGYMTEALGVLEKEIFNNLGINRINIKCDEKNIGSKRVAEKCGYLLEGTLREDTYSEHFDDFRNTLFFSKIRSDFDKQE